MPQPDLDTTLRPTTPDPLDALRDLDLADFSDWTNADLLDAYTGACVAATRCAVRVASLEDLPRVTGITAFQRGAGKQSLDRLRAAQAEYDRQATAIRTEIEGRMSG